MGEPRNFGSAITVLVADRHELVRHALRELIDVEPGFAVVGQAGAVAALPPQLRRHRPHVLLVEPELLGGSGLLRLPTVLSPSPDTRAVVLADEASAALERHATGHGASGLVVKHAPPDELFAVLRRVVLGGLGTLRPRPADA